MSKQQEMHYKDVMPMETVNKLKGILEEIGVEVEEQTKLESDIGTHSIRLVFKGTDFGSNGKGVSEEYCLASAYAEFFERYQNDLNPRWKVDRKSKYSFKMAFDEKILSTSEIISDDNNSFINYYFKKRNISNSSFTDRVDAFESVQRGDFWQYNFDGKYVCLPFYSVKYDKITYLPYSAYALHYGSNGMCAGNSYEEALVQGLSEIIERVSQRRILTEKPVLPDVPDEYIKKFPYVYELLEKLRSNQDFVCKIKDCSFGGKYPVAALVILEKNTGRFGVKLGCHPDFGVAIERTITEAAQGNNIYEFVNRSVIDFDNAYVDGDTNICNSFKTANAQFPYQIIGRKPTYDFVMPKDVSEISNKEMLKMWTNEIISEGYDILIRNVSSFGFPSFHIIIPGLSELQNVDDLKIKANNTKSLVQMLLTRPEEINSNNVQYIISTLNYFKNSLFENNIKNYFSADNTFQYPGDDVYLGSEYMLLMCYIIAEDFENAKIKALNLYNRACQLNVNKNFYTALYYYVSAMKTLKSHADVMVYIVDMFDENISNKIEWLFGSDNIIGKQYPCKKESFNEDDPYIISFKAREQLFEAQVKSKIEQIDVRKIFLD